MTDTDYLKRAIELSEESSKQGRFPAGALIVKDGQVLAFALSATYPGYSHAEKSAIDEASKLGLNQLSGAALYCSLEPCMMCLSTAIWSGITKIVYACGRESVSPDYYEPITEEAKFIEGVIDVRQLIDDDVDLQVEAIKIIQNWEIKSGAGHH